MTPRAHLTPRVHLTPRAHLTLLAGLAALGALLGWLSRAVGVLDLHLFATAGEAILSGRWDAVYADPTVQAGPLVLVLAALCERVGGATAVCLVGMPLVPVAAALATRLLRHALRRPRAPGVELAAATAALAWESGQGAVLDGHLAQGLIPALWVGAGLALLRRRPLTAGVLLGLATGCETWGALGVPLVVLGPRRDTARALITAVTAAGALYLPFALAGPFRMFDLRWAVMPDSLPGRLGLFEDGLPWWARCAQAGLAVAGGALVVRSRRDWDAVWAALLVIVTVRLTLDPQAFTYYWTPVVALGLAGAVTADPRAGRLRLVAPVLIVWWQFLPAADSWVGLLLVTLPAAIATATRTSTPADGERPRPNLSR